MALEPIVRMQVTVNATAERAWSALSDGDALQGWYAEHAQVDLAAGRYDFWGQFTAGTPDREGGRHDLLDCQTGRSLAFAWRRGRHDTVVRIELHPRGERCIVALEHSAGSNRQDDDIAPYTYADEWFIALENLRRWLDGRPAGIRIPWSADMRGNIDVDCLVDAPASRVWAVLCDERELERWMATAATIDPRVGGDYDLGWPGMQPMRIRELEPERRLAYSMSDEGGPQNSARWTLQPEAGGTRLALLNSGYAPDDDTSGLHVGWRNFLGWARSAAEYGADWQPPLLKLSPDAIAFPRLMLELQDELVWQD
ncbi:MAG: SRPBCC family protein [Anaerolineaceae bacterium]|nr:SRPBCC family protein [Anaerolineaceae bacterium]